MALRWVVNASPLIVLSKIGHQHLLTELADEIIVPEGVATEVEAGPSDDPARMFLRSNAIPVVPVSPNPSVVAWDLGRGETEVISYCLENPDWIAVLDDGMARRCARAFGASVIGTLAVIILARERGIIEAAAPVLHSLIAYGFRIDEAIVREALRTTIDERF